MKTFSIMETQHHLSKVLREVEAGHEVGITRRNKLVARILPPLRKEEIQFPDFASRARKVWGGKTSGASSSELLEDTRGDQ